jgi:hypothetical protein
LLENIILTKYASVREREHHSVLAPALAGLAIAGTGMLVHNGNKILKDLNISKAIQDLREFSANDTKTFEDVIGNIKDNTALKNNFKDLTIIRDEHDLDRYYSKYKREKLNPTGLKDQVIEHLERSRIESAHASMQDALRSNGVFVGQKRTGILKNDSGERDWIHPFIYTPENRGTTLAHELGHADQYFSGDLEKMYAPKERLKGYFKSLVDPKKQALYRIEEDAWNRAGIDKGNGIRDSALKTYEESAKTNRTHALALGTGIGGAALVAHSVRNDRTNRN